MREPIKSIAELLNQILRTRNEMVRDLGADDFAVLAPAAGADSIARAEAHLKLTFPPAYRAFLLNSNGVRDFADEIDLFSVEEMTCAGYSELAQEIRELGWTNGERVLVDGLLIGGRVGDRNVFMIDYAGEPDEWNERPVVYWSDMTLLVAADFRAFLEKWCDVAEQHRAIENRNMRDAEPGA